MKAELTGQVLEVVEENKDLDLEIMRYSNKLFKHRIVAGSLLAAIVVLVVVRFVFL